MSIRIGQKLLQLGPYDYLWSGTAHGQEETKDTPILVAFLIFYEPRFGNLKFTLFKLRVYLSFLLRPFIFKMPCHRSCKKFAPRPPPTYDEALHASSSLDLPIGAYVARHQPYSLSYRFEREYTDAPEPQISAMIPQTGRFIVPPPYDLDDYVESNDEETGEDEEDEEDWDDADEDDQEWDVRMPDIQGSVARFVRFCILVLIVLESYFV